MNASSRKTRTFFGLPPWAPGSCQPTAGGLVADEERALDNTAAMLGQQNTFDASPDGLGANEAEVTTQDNRMSDTNRSGNAR